METSFKISKKSKYFQIDYVSGLDYVPFTNGKYIWATRKEQAREFIKRVKEIETFLIKLISDNHVPYDYRLIIHRYLEAIDSISTGLDIRSNMTSEQLAENFYFWYDKKYKEAYNTCKDIHSKYEVSGRFNTYLSNWREYDSYNQMVKEYLLPFELLNESKFKISELAQMGKLLDKMLKTVKKNKKK